MLKKQLFFSSNCRSFLKTKWVLCTAITSRLGFKRYFRTWDERLWTFDSFMFTLDKLRAITHYMIQWCTWSKNPLSEDTDGLPKTTNAKIVRNPTVPGDSTNICGEFQLRYLLKWRVNRNSDPPWTIMQHFLEYRLSQSVNLTPIKALLAASTVCRTLRRP